MKWAIKEHNTEYGSSRILDGTFDTKEEASAECRLLNTSAEIDDDDDLFFSVVVAS